jgi:HlyD family secretion protein
MARLRKYRKLFGYAALAMAIGGVTIWRVSAGAPVKAQKYQTAAVANRNLELSVSASGTLEPLDAIDIGTEISGRIREVRARANDSVKVGQVLVVMDTEQLDSRLKEAEASLEMAQAREAEARATITEAESRFARSSRLVGMGFISAQDLDTSKAALERSRASMRVAEAQIRGATQQLFEAKANLSKATIRSPIDGVVIARAVEPGQTVAAVFQIPFLLKLSKPLREMSLRILVNEADVGDIAEGQEVTFVADAFPGRTFKARMRELRNTPRSVQGAVMYEGVMTVENDDAALRPGMTVTARISTHSLPNVLTVPNASLRFVPNDQPDRIPAPDGAPSNDARPGNVWVLRNGMPVAVALNIGRSDGRYTAVKAGAINASDQVIVEQVDHS